MASEKAKLMSESGILHAGWSLAANDEGTPPRVMRDFRSDPATIALICASRMTNQGFQVLSAPGCAVPLARDEAGVFHFVRARA